MAKPENRFVSAYGPKLKSQVDCGGFDASKTKQSFKDDCDINKIMARYVRTGVLDFVSKYEPRYGDVSGVDYQRSMTLVAESRGMFSQLPAEMRARFDNDAGAFVEFVSNPENREAMLELGLTSDSRRGSVDPAAMKRRKGDNDGRDQVQTGVGRSDGVAEASERYGGTGREAVADDRRADRRAVASEQAAGQREEVGRR